MRGLTGDGQEFQATTVDVCAGGLRINLARPMKVGENLVLYIDDIGRVEGVVARVLSEIGYAIEFKVPPRKREKIADQLTWLINRDRLGLTDEREAERRIGGSQVLATFGKGVPVACTVADVSIFGVALRTTGPRPMIGDAVTVGERTGTCVRYIEGGFASTSARCTRKWARPRPPPPAPASSARNYMFRRLEMRQTAQPRRRTQCRPAVGPLEEPLATKAAHCGSNPLARKRERFAQRFIGNWQGQFASRREVLKLPGAIAAP